LLESLQEVLRRLLTVAQAVTEAGPGAGGGLLVAGFLLLLLGYRVFRPTAALVGAMAGAVAVAEWVRHTHTSLPTSLPLAMAAAGLVAFALGLAWPSMVVIASGGLFTFLFALEVTPRVDPDVVLVIWTAALAIGVILPALFYSSLPALVVPPVAASLITLGGWGLFGLRHAHSLLYEVPAAWIVFAGIITLSSWIVESARLSRWHERRAPEKAKA
jgi:hypothetical protein